MIKKNIFSPVPRIGGLEISDLSLRFLRLENGKLNQASVSLPPGIISSGKIIEKAKLASALKKLHQHIQPLEKPVYVVLAMPAGNVYIQSFTMPMVSEKHMKESAELNLRMISPIDTRSSYYGYEIIGETGETQLEALGAFTGAEGVNELIAVLKEANFRAVAVESPSLSLARLMAGHDDSEKSDKAYLVVNFSYDGPDLMIMKNGHLYFNYFSYWSDIQKEYGERKLTERDIKEFLARQIRQITNFYTSRSGEPIGKVLVISDGAGQSFLKMIKEDFDLDAQLYKFKEFSGLSPIWYGALGAAFRGLVPRSKDKFISLTAVDVKEEYYRELTLNFIKLWRNIIAGVFGFLILVFLAANIYLVSVSASAIEDLSSRSLAPLNEIKNLQANVQQFNRGVDLALKAQELSEPWSPLLEKISLLAGQRITIERFFVDQNSSALILGRAANDSAVIAFKNSIEKESNFKDVVLPLSNIKVNPDGTVSFTLQFKVASLKF